MKIVVVMSGGIGCFDNLSIDIIEGDDFRSAVLPYITKWYKEQELDWDDVDDEGNDVVFDPNIIVDNVIVPIWDKSTTKDIYVYDYEITSYVEHSICDHSFRFKLID